MQSYHRHNGVFMEGSVDKGLSRWCVVGMPYVIFCNIARIMYDYADNICYKYH